VGVVMLVLLEAFLFLLFTPAGQVVIPGELADSLFRRADAFILDRSHVL